LLQSYTRALTSEELAGLGSVLLPNMSSSWRRKVATASASGRALIASALSPHTKPVMLSVVMWGWVGV
jgi:hypothetical protein